MVAMAAHSWSCLVHSQSVSRDTVQSPVVGPALPSATVHSEVGDWRACATHCTSHAQSIHPRSMSAHGSSTTFFAVLCSRGVTLGSGEGGRSRARWVQKAHEPVLWAEWGRPRPLVERLLGSPRSRSLGGWWLTHCTLPSGVPPCGVAW